MFPAVIVIGVFALMYSYWANTLALAKHVTGMRVFWYITFPAVVGELIGDVLYNRYYMGESTTLFLYFVLGVVALPLELYGGGLNTPAKYHSEGGTGHYEGYYFEENRYRVVGAGWNTYQSLKAEISTLLPIRACITMICARSSLDVIRIIFHCTYLS